MAYETQPSRASHTTGAGAGQQMHPNPNANRLGAFLCWAVVFADIGTSVYYVPGILYNYNGIGRLAGFFVFLTLIAFLLLTLKYAEVSSRFPEGGGVVTVATHGISPWAGAVGGMFILVDYFLTSAISSLSGLLYFQAILPRLGATIHLGLGQFAVPVALTLLITLIVVALLGVLNWYGIKESASVSAVIATAAFLSDIVILIVIFARVPLNTIGQVFAAMFTGKTMTPLLLLTGFAGAFLAFSGLESISQLSPVMRLPRRKTVSIALGIVVITVGVTSPLLTMFSTVLLTDPQFSSVLAVPHYAQYHMANPAAFDPNQFISLLAGAFGGRILEVATAVVASCLLIFASNTAIIGAYHVFLALSRMKFFPDVVERQNKLRGTPHVSIALATVIPIVVLVAVNGNVNTLGDLYAFGLLGAFSLTCLSMDIIRFRERHGAPHIGAEVDPELLGVPAFVQSMPPSAPSALVHAYDAMLPAPVRAEIHRIVARVSTAWPPLAERLKQPFSTFTYYIGFPTTIMVVVAWAVNLYFKPLATIFGGGITLLGVAVAVANYQYLQQRGVAPAYLSLPSPMPNSWLVVLSPDVQASRKVVEAVVRSAQSHPLAFLYLTPTLPDMSPPRLFEIRDRYGHDRQAQDVLSFAKRVSKRANVSAKFLYAVGGAKQVFDIAQRIRPDEIVAQKDFAKRITHALPTERGMAVSPEYVRFQSFDGVTVAHNVLHHLYATAAAGSTAGRPASEQHTLAQAARLLRQRLTQRLITLMTHQPPPEAPSGGQAPTGKQGKPQDKPSSVAELPAAGTSEPDTPEPNGTYGKAADRRVTEEENKSRRRDGERDAASENPTTHTPTPLN